MINTKFVFKINAKFGCSALARCSVSRRRRCSYSALHPTRIHCQRCLQPAPLQARFCPLNSFLRRSERASPHSSETVKNFDIVSACDFCHPHRTAFACLNTRGSYEAIGEQLIDISDCAQPFDPVAPLLTSSITFLTHHSSRRGAHLHYWVALVFAIRCRFMGRFDVALWGGAHQRRRH